MSILYISLALLGIGLIIFIHEAGHFFAAKKVGVRVERFALGFDPTIRGRRLRFLSFQRGETEYVLGMIPFGGYVKMAGELIPEEAGSKPKEDELLAKSVGARALVFVAGAAMNIVSACIFFMIAFSIGVPFVDAKIGSVVPGSEAWKQGLRPGDNVVAINGKEINEFYELVLGVALSSDGEPLALTVERPTQPNDPDSEIKKVSITVHPRWNAERGMNEVGITPALRSIIPQDPEKGSSAAKAGLKKGDRVIGLEIDGRELPQVAPVSLMRALGTRLQMQGDRPVRLKVDRDGKTEWLTIEPDAKAETDDKLRVVRFLGSGGGTVVRDLVPGSSATKHLKPGDRVVAVGGRVVGSMDWQNLLASVEGDTTELRKVSSEGEESSTTVRVDEILGWSLRSEVLWSADGLLVKEVAADSSAKKAGILPGDRITRLDGKLVFDAAELEAALRSGTHELEVYTETQSRKTSIEAAEESGIVWNAFPSIGVVTEGGPAAAAGIVAGSRVVEFAGTAVDSLARFQDLVRNTEIGADAEPVEIAWIDPAGTRQKGRIKPVALTLTDPKIPTENEHVTVVSEGILHSFELGAKRVVHIGKQVFMTLRSLIRSDVSAKNLSGPVGITHVFTQAAQDGLGRLIYFMAMVSVNLGLLNLLPFPILDGGHLLFLLIEKIKGSPVSIKVQELATTVAFFLIIALFLFVTFHDIRRALPF